MFCTKCGKNIEDTAAFCVHCGSKVEGQPAQPQYAPQQQPAGYAPPKKSNKGLIIGIIAGAAVVAIVLILVLVVFPGGSSDIMGKWYDETGYSTVEFMGGGNCKMSAMGMELDATYTFDANSKEGEMTMSFMGMTETSSFSINDKGILNIEGTEYSKTPVEQKGLDDMFGDLNLDGLNMDGLDLG